MPLTPGLVANIPQVAPPEAAKEPEADVIVESADTGVDRPEMDDVGNILKIEHADGSVSVSIDGSPIERAAGAAGNGGWFDNLVDRIEDYPLFLPWCGGSKVIERNDEITKASILIKYSGVNQSFTTQNTKKYPHRIDLKLIDGPFKVLNGFWIFTPINEDACSIEFHLH